MKPLGSNMFTRISAIYFNTEVVFPQKNIYIFWLYGLLSVIAFF